ncbi:MAG: pantetheine-phosphate adenylyltransferase [Yaniella sp.]|uniref:pantetheine-phosphate adenylyltransferase n=1 Tax=Yaniella sp. TaxID=2773929 RepID=UPI00264733D4|nr:pantetheine-phosphate adenylyltransferase [Yaniella sp.]MDN5703827.1 pantetheine-phosphate adenylyltransferase [Yaniella sp.]MDN5731571.1 pantetheine-phosphate adenylyltransferase [Yaniella sp.]MDN5741941.1 pantetheine-phosphate adenylyltransferase [Yaniella sp.]MDN5816238.1 pantetheine-phosphate adenylyltransferase [Yaniella sp.]MDN5817392.1 pantetheine-phosphate adenylyltransferase [Yaniella sp.]
MQRAVCPGSFDPVHNGHIEIIIRAASLFDEVIVAVSNNPAKNYRFSLQERMDMISETLKSIQGVIVMPLGTGLIADFAREQGAQAMVKGIRNSTDLNYEMPMATFNRHLSSVETVFLPADSRYQHVSSTLVKEIVGFKGDITDFIPYAVAQRFGLR